MARATTIFLDLGSRYAHSLAAVALLFGLTATAAAGVPVESAVAAALWSAPSVLSTCPASEAPLVVFPSDSPTHATGPGAIVWDAVSGCPDGGDAQVTTLGSGDVPDLPALPRTADSLTLRLRGPLVAGGGPYGRIVLAGSSAPSQGELTEGSALGPFSAPTTISASPAPPTLATAYLGDVALASSSLTHAGEEVQLRVQRHRAPTFARTIAVSAGASGRVAALTVALDYRSDALAVWRRGESIYARDLPVSGRTRAPIQRLGPSVGSPSRIAALLSDDNRGIVAWSAQSGEETSVYLDLSAGGVRFGAPRLLERFEDPGGLPPEGSSPRLIRLSSESVMLAWTGSDGSKWSVRTAAIDLNGLGPVATISPPGRDAVLSALAPGPDGEALALWTEPQRDAADRSEPDRQAIFTARGIDARPARTIFGEPEEVAAPGPNSGATVALDPDGGRAVAAWRGEGGAIDYSIRTPSSP
ncbi:MAG TPA: hypothetical protein VGL68_01285 [Solirubrobacteraceae bacterium]|jgi:hypothetical protein